MEYVILECVLILMIFGMILILMYENFRLHDQILDLEEQLDYYEEKEMGYRELKNYDLSKEL